ncbi:mechanosensitive ion channel family protein [Parvularcula sp. LCG005]|uniref:mechanosensitive ion channel family protein n=1 Tax=Parvularcula sp. LCG005 TaxID=3078805 RepID=UPI002943BB23|nr:mechanosensitive ion channel domain-containing protein [Parvularcula sp. LCG005]WOI53353.1 mechanosensitive ion channel [Parvularcula sp. LCG005]
MQNQPASTDTVRIEANGTVIEVPRDAAERALGQQAAVQQAPMEEAQPIDQSLDGATPPDAPADVPPVVGEDSPSGLADIFAMDSLKQRGLDIWLWIQEHVLTVNMGIQLALIVAAFVPALIFGPKLKRLINRHLRQRMPPGILRRASDAFATVATLIALWLTLSLFSGILAGMGQSNAVISAVQSLLTAAIVIRLVTLVIRSPFWSKVAFYVAWPIAALDAFGVLDDVAASLKAASIPLGENAAGDAVTLSALDVVRAAIIFAIFFWIASLAAGIINRQIQNVDELNPSFKALLAKVLNFVMPVIALVFALNMIGFNLASLAVFSGAVGLGIGLGLQKIISNFLAGFTLLADKSIKPGDTVEVDGVYGWITEMKSRYVAIRTRDGTAHLVPNSVFIDEGVVNWSHDDRAVRVKADFGVTYNQRDLELVQKLAVEAAEGVERVLEKPGPVCNLVGFGDSSVDFSLRFWINDPPNGIANVKSQVMMRLWHALHDHNIEIPFPQRDLHIRSSDVDFRRLSSASAED